jgi:high-affinity Fe2+/Pb2+ permease
MYIKGYRVMLTSLAITLREGLETILIMGTIAPGAAKA